MNTILCLLAVIAISVYMVSLAVRGYKANILRAIGDLANTSLMLTLAIKHIGQENCLTAAICILFAVLDLICLWYNIENYIKLKNENMPNEREAFIKKIENYGSK